MTIFREGDYRGYHITVSEHSAQLGTFCIRAVRNKTDLRAGNFATMAEVDAWLRNTLVAEAA